MAFFVYMANGRARNYLELTHIRVDTTGHWPLVIDHWPLIIMVADKGANRSNKEHPPKH